MPATAPFFYRITEGIRITVRPTFLPEQSIPEQRQYVFAYNVRIENTSQQSVQLLFRPPNPITKALLKESPTALSNTL